MKLQQLRYIWEVARHGLNVSTTAQRLYTSQPGISKQIRLLESELGIEIFARSGKHLTRITPAGHTVIDLAGQILHLTRHIKQVAQEHNDEHQGSLTLATTHTQARYVLPPIIKAFGEHHPGISLHMHQGSPQQIAQMVVDGQADIAICTEAVADYHDVIALPWYRWNRSVLVPKGHPLCDEAQLTLAELAQYPLVTYTSGFTGSAQLAKNFQQQGLTPNIVLTAADADVIKTYVRLGLGVGIVAHMAAVAEDDELVAIDARHLFDYSVTRIALRQGSYLRRYMYDFIERMAPHLTRERVDEAMQRLSSTSSPLQDIELPER